MQLKLNHILSFALISTFTCFSQTNDNLELREIYAADQGDRSVENIDWSVVSINDSLREIRIYEMLDSNLVITANDHANAAMIFQHGADSTAYRMTIKLMKRAIELDSTQNKWLLAASIDRELMSRDKPQVYGTQFIMNMQEDGTWGPWERYNMDTTVITDAERIEYNVETLEEQRKKIYLMSWRPLQDSIHKGKTTKEVLSFYREERKKDPNSKYIAELEINYFGYELIKRDKLKAALKVFKINVEFYPNASNTYDSLGECLLLLGKTRQGKKAYKKALELDPKNYGAFLILNPHSK